MPHQTPDQAHNSSTNSKPHTDLIPTLILSPNKAAIPAQGGHLDVLVRLQAPDLSADHPAKHTPKRLSLVVDRSGSMSGRPLKEALRCVLHIARHLTPQDQVSLVFYDDEVSVLFPLQHMTSIQAIAQAVADVEEGGSTNLFGGWLAGAEELEGGSESSISRVLLLSDGQANCGETDVGRIEEHCKQWLARGVSTTTVGLGRGFNEELMMAMAREGEGQQYYGQTAADLFDSFDEELALLQALYLRKIGLTLVPEPGVVVELLSTIQQNDDGSYRMNDLAWGSESWVSLRLHITPSAAGSMRDLLSFSASGVDLEGRSARHASKTLQLPVVDLATFNALPADELVARRALEIAFGKAAQELRDLAKRGNREDTLHSLQQMDARFGDHPWLKAKMAQLHRLAEQDMEMMMKEASFSSMRMSRRLASKSEMMFSADETESEMPAFLRMKVSEGHGRRNEK